MMILGAAMVPSIVRVSRYNLGRTLNVGVVAECSRSNGTRHNHSLPLSFIFTNAEKTRPRSAEKRPTAAVTWPLRRDLRRTCKSVGAEGCLFRRTSVTRPPTPEGDEEKVSEPSLQEIINVKLVESGEKERLKELLRERLVECGWRDELKAQCRAYTRKRGRANITVDELVRTITPRGRATVPDNVKAELLQRIRVFLMSDAL